MLADRYGFDPVPYYPLTGFLLLTSIIDFGWNLAFGVLPGLLGRPEVLSRQRPRHVVAVPPRRRVRRDGQPHLGLTRGSPSTRSTG